MRVQASGIGLALAVLATGFALAGTGPGQAVGDAVARALAVLAAPVLHLIEPGLLLAGTELRSPDGWAIRVSEVCDGHGLAISLAAALAALAPDLRKGALRFVFGMAAIQVFNLGRIILLAITLDHMPGRFDFIHAQVFPFLTVALLAFCLLPRRQAAILCAAALPLVLVWLGLSDMLARPLALGANLILSLVAGPEVGQIAERAAGWTIGTGLVATQEGGTVTRYLAPLRPADFGIGLPVLLASIAVARRPLLLALAAASLLASLVIAGVATVWSLASALDPALLLVTTPEGESLTQTFTVPARGLPLAQLAQSVLVHFNLLVLPFLILAGRGRHA